MSTSVKLSQEMITEAKVKSKVFNRSIAGQIEYWAKIGRIAEENPDLTYEFVKKILISLNEIEQGLGEPYVFRKK